MEIDGDYNVIWIDMALYGLVGCMGVMILILIFFDLASFYMFLQVSPSNYRDILWGFLSFFFFRFYHQKSKGFW